jgi:hypothetical protein
MAYVTEETRVSNSGTFCRLTTKTNHAYGTGWKPPLSTSLDIPRFILKFFLTRSSILMLFCSAPGLRETSTSFLLSSCRHYIIFKTHKKVLCLHLTASNVHTRYNSCTSTKDYAAFRFSATLHVATPLRFYKRCVNEVLHKGNTPRVMFSPSKYVKYSVDILRSLSYTQFISK